MQGILPALPVVLPALSSNPVGWGIAIGLVVILFAAEHTKNKRPSNHDKHTKPRSGRPNTKNRLKPGWKDRSNKKK